MQNKDTQTNEKNNKVKSRTFPNKKNKTIKGVFFWQK